MKIYLASGRSRLEEMADYAEQLIADGHKITSRWVILPETMPETMDVERSIESYSEGESIQFAEQSYLDVVASDLLLAFTESPDSLGNKGGRHVETGMAIALKKVVCVVGPRENIFHAMALHFNTFEEVRTWLQGLRYHRYRGE